MCGIVGYIGPKAVDSVLLVGLERLQYRGYDSAGMAVVTNGEIQIRKEAGKIKKLEKSLKLEPLTGNIGIGHTRWATHGVPNQINAHPQLDNRGHFAVVQNGIIENFYSLKEKLIKEGFNFVSDTDTEVIAHLLDKYYRETGDVMQSLVKMAAVIEGKFAITLVTDKDPDKVFFIKDGTPLVIGSGQGEMYLGSDLPAIVPMTRKVAFLKDKSLGYLTREAAHVFDFEFQELPPEYKEISIRVEDMDKGEYDYFMQKEIFEQPNIIRSILSRRINDKNEILFPELDMSPEYLNNVSRFIIQACGTSWHAGLVGKLLIEEFTRIHTEVDVSSEFRYRNPVVEGDTVVMAISQSGETADTLAAIREAKAKFVKVLSFVNNVNSAIKRESDAFVELMAGTEIGVASTKAYTAELLNLILFALYMARIKNQIEPEKLTEIIQEIRRLPVAMESILQKEEQYRECARKLREARDFVFLGRTYNYPTALEGALKLKEISYIHSSGYAGGEFKHGPIALITEEVPVVCVAPKSEIYAKVVGNIQEVKSRKGIIVAVVTEGDKEIASYADYLFEIPECPEILSPLLTIIPLQLLSYYMAVEKGCDVDRPRNLAKSVTVE